MGHGGNGNGDGTSMGLFEKLIVLLLAEKAGVGIDPAATADDLAMAADEIPTDDMDAAVDPEATSEMIAK